MKAGKLVVPLLLLAAATFVLPSAFAQQGVIYAYMIHVDFFTYSCSLTVAQVSLYASGDMLGASASPYGGEIEILIRSPTALPTLTATASGVATWNSYSWPVTGSGSITLGTTGDYWVTLRMN